MGRSFVIDEENGDTLRGYIEGTVTNKDGMTSVITKIGDGERAYEDIMDYHDLCDLLRRQAEAEDNREMTFLPFNRVSTLR